MYDNPKYYRTTRVVRKQTTRLEEARTHLQLTSDHFSGHLQFQLEARQSIHVGSGQLTPPRSLGLDSHYPMVKAFIRAGETLILPGSSLKGMTRSLFEAFTHACVCKTTVRWNRGERDDYGECRYNSKRREGNLCIACRLFGAMGYQGQVRFNDAPLVRGERTVIEIPPQYKPEPDSELRRHYPYDMADPRNPTWPLEGVFSGTIFLAKGQFTNLTNAELGALLIALGQGQWQLHPRIGAGKSSGLGGLNIVDLTVERQDIAQSYSSLESQWQPVDIDGCIAAAASLLRTDALNQLANDLGERNH
ncbi:MAG: RAMP superfamily CRISPR-associated protein [Chloroflexota bacterium]